MFRVINSCKRIIKIGDTLINYGKFADFDDSYLYELENFKQLINNSSIKIIYNINSKKTIGYKLEKKPIYDPELEITEKNPKNKDSVENNIKETVEEKSEVTETETKSKRKKKKSEDEENKDN